jgi:mannose-1-phosphate guanylyltransferase
MSDFNEFVRLDGDILTPYAGKKALYVHESKGFWEQVKTPSMMLRAAELYLGSFSEKAPGMMLKHSAAGPAVSGAVYMHPGASVHPSAKLGPNCSIAPGVRVGVGARLSNCIVLDGAVIGEHAVVSNAIIGWQCKVGAWARVQGTAEYSAKLGAAILGEDVTVADEVVIVSCVVLPHKEIKASISNEVVM